MPRDIAYYLSRGFAPPMAECFVSGRKRLEQVRPLDPYHILLTYEGNEQRIFDCAPLIQEGTAFAPLKDPAVFCCVYVSDSHCITWNIDPTINSTKAWDNVIDLDPDVCYVKSGAVAET